MHRSYLRTLLHTYHPTDRAEQASKTRMLTFLEAYPNCFERSLEIGHFTASSWLVNSTNTQALLTHHTKLGKWFQLGGHCDGNPNVLEVALTEAREESGILAIEPMSTEIFDIDVHLIPARGSEPEHYHYDVRFLLQATGSQEVVQNRESKELRWIGRAPHELPTQEHSVVRMFTKWVAGTP